MQTTIHHAAVHRIFPVLLLLAAAFFAVTVFVGFNADSAITANTAADEDSRHWSTVHFLLALTTSLAVMFVNSVVVTYFIGTSRWCREVVEAYSLRPELAQRSYQLKRRTFPFSLVNMLAIIGLAALGAAADTVSTSGSISWTEFHLLGVLLTLAFMAFASYVQWSNIRANQIVIGDILAEVRLIRAEKGLD